LLQEFRRIADRDFDGHNDGEDVTSSNLYLLDKARLPEPPDDTVPSPAQRQGRLPRRLPSWAPAAIPALLMLIIGGTGIRRPGLGWDENATWLVSQRTVAQIVEQAGHFDGVISPYYMFMHFWTAVFGDSEFWLRAPSLICVALGVGLVGELGRRLLSPGTGLLAGLLLILVPQLSRYAQDARAYGFAFLFGTLATLLLYRALQRPAWARWIAYAVAVMLLGFAHILGLLILIGHGYAVISRSWRADRTPALRWLLATAAAVVPVLPLIYLGLTQRGDQLDWIPEMNLRQVEAAPGDIFGSAAAGLLLIGLALAVRASDKRVPRELAVLAVAPPVALIAVSFVTDSLWVPRYVLVVLPAICLCAAAAVRAMPLRTAAALLLLACVSVPAQTSVRKPTSHMGPDFRTIAGEITRNQQPGDVIVYGASGTWSLRAGIDYQLRGRPKPHDVLLSIPAAQAGELNAVQCADPVACLGTPRRIWFFRYAQPGKPLPDAGPLTDAGALQDTLTRDYRQAGAWQATKSDLILFER